MKKAIVLLMIVVLATSFAIAEDDNNMDAGLRGGLRSGLTGRFWMEDNPIEALVTFRGSGLILTGLYEWHKPLEIGELEGLSWYFGGGAHVGYYSLGDWVIGGNNDFALGIDGVVGIEYELEQHINFPLSVSLDYKPGFDIIGGWAGNFGDAALAVRWDF